MLSDKDLAGLRTQQFWSAALSLPVYAFVLAATRLRFGYRFKDLKAFQRAVWKELDAHPGPVIWAANHLTLIDSFLVFRAVFPYSRAWSFRRIPWSTPEYRNYYHLGGPVRQRLIRALLYLCRCIPFLREGEDEASVRWRDAAFEKCVWVLRRGGSIFVYPEAGRARNGWFEARRPKDFLGRMALEAPEARFLCVYLRGESQAYTTAEPRRGERFRMEFALTPAVLPGETSPRQISERLFSELGRLQDRWWRGSRLRRNCGGNDVVDLRSPRLTENMDPRSGEADQEWLQRHLTAKERDYLAAQPAEKRFATFWKFFAAKEAAHKALAQAGLVLPLGAFLALEADLFRRKVAYRAGDVQLDIAFTAEDEDKLHCVAVLRGGYIGDDHNPGDVLWKVAEVPSGRAAGEFVRELCLSLIAESSDDIPSPDALAFGEQDGAPVVLRRGKPADWGVSLSHCGRYAACSFMIS